jgi:MFS family permease
VRAENSSRWWALVAVSLANFMAYLDNNVTNVALPTIQRSLHLSTAGLEWVVIGLAVFTLSSLVAGLAGSGGMLIGARAVQGLGAALLMPTTLAIILATFQDVRERTTVRASSLRGGTSAAGAFLDGYHAGLWVTIGVLAAGVVLSYVTLRPRRSAVSTGFEPDVEHSVGSSWAIPELLTEE